MGYGEAWTVTGKKHTRTNDSNCNDKNYAEHCFVWAFTAGFRTNRAHKLTETFLKISNFCRYIIKTRCGSACLASFVLKVKFEGGHQRFSR